VLAAEHKLTVGSEATCSVLPGDYSGHRAEKISRFIIRFNTYYLEFNSDLQPFLTEKYNIQETV
jgi:hypothetical protein